MAMLKYVKREAHPSNKQLILSQQDIEAAQKKSRMARLLFFFHIRMGKTEGSVNFA